MAESTEQFITIKKMKSNYCNNDGIREIIKRNDSEQEKILLCFLSKHENSFMAQHSINLGKRDFFHKKFSLLDDEKCAAIYAWGWCKGFQYQVLERGGGQMRKNIKFMLLTLHQRIQLI